MVIAPEDWEGRLISIWAKKIDTNWHGVTERSAQLQASQCSLEAPPRSPMRAAVWCIKKQSPGAVGAQVADCLSVPAQRQKWRPN